MHRDCEEPNILDVLWRWKTANTVDKGIVIAWILGFSMSVKMRLAFWFRGRALSVRVRESGLTTSRNYGMLDGRLDRAVISVLRLMLMNDHRTQHYSGGSVGTIETKSIRQPLLRTNLPKVANST